MVSWLMWALFVWLCLGMVWYNVIRPVRPRRRATRTSKPVPLPSDGEWEWWLKNDPVIAEIDAARERAELKARARTRARGTARIAVDRGVLSPGQYRHITGEPWHPLPEDPDGTYETIMSADGLLAARIRTDRPDSRSTPVTGRP